MVGFCSHVSQRQLCRLGLPLMSSTGVHDSFVAVATVIGSSDWRGDCSDVCSSSGTVCGVD